MGPTMSFPSELENSNFHEGRAGSVWHRSIWVVMCCSAADHLHTEGVITLWGGGVSPATLGGNGVRQKFIHA